MLLKFNQKDILCMFIYQIWFLIFEAGEKTNPNMKLQFYTLIISQIWATTW